LAAGGTLIISINPIIMPPSTAEFSNIEVWTADSNINIIDYRSGMSLFMTTPGTFTSASYGKIVTNPGISETNAVY
jgi:hypothetical protein